MAVTALAQVPRLADASAGYQWQRVSDSGCNGANCSDSLPLGWYVDASGRLPWTLSWVAQADGSYRNDAFGSPGFNFKVHTIGGGVRVNTGIGSLNPFAQVVAGAMHASLAGSSGALSASASDTVVMLDLGGGVTVPWTAKWAVRGSVGYRRGFVKSDSNLFDGAVNAVRLNVGVVYNLQ
jgi:hypothetical protein